MFRDAAGPLYDFLKGIGRRMDDCGGKTPLSSLRQSQALGEHWILAHLNELTESDFDLLARTARFHIAHCPRSHTYFGHTPFALRKLQALGFNICLGTDSLASNSSLSLLAEMRELLRKEPWLSPREVLLMTTVNGCARLGPDWRAGENQSRFSGGLDRDSISRNRKGRFRGHRRIRRNGAVDDGERRNLKPSLSYSFLVS